MNGFTDRYVNNSECIDFQKIKDECGVVGVKKVVEEMGGKCWEDNAEFMVFDSICYHLDCAGHKPKMYYYKQTKCFMDYKLGCSFDIVEMVQRRKELLGQELTMIQCANIICGILGIDGYKEPKKKRGYDYLSELQCFLKGHKPKKEMLIYDRKILNEFPRIYHMDWINDGISIDSMEKYGIRYYPTENQIVIPCQNSHGDLVGIRVRNIDPRQDWKYRPLITFNGFEYRFPTNKILYGLNYTRYAIEKYRKAMLFEAEKSVLQCDGFFGENNIACAMFGSAFSEEKRDLLLGLGVEEVIICVDFDYEKANDNDKKYVKFKEKINTIAEFFDGFCKVTYLIERGEHPLKCSPSDRGKKKFMELFRNREVWNER